MADEPTNVTQTEGAESTDWKAKYEEMRGHAREWEKMAKANKSAADELEQLKAAQMSEQEKANARAEAAESELAAIKAEQARADAAMKISNDTGVPLEMLLFCSDEGAMTEFAKKYAEDARIPAASGAAGKRIIRSNNEKPPTNGELFADFAAGFFK